MDSASGLAASLCVKSRADPHAGCCGGWGRKIPGYPTRRLSENAKVEKLTTVYSVCMNCLAQYIAYKISIIEFSDSLLEPAQPIGGTAAAMGNGQYFHGTRAFSKQHREWELLHSSAPYIRLLVNRVSVGILRYAGHDIFEFGQVGCTKTWSFRLIIGDCLKMLCFRGWVKRVIHLSSAFALCLTSSAGMG